tara:strand:+ start:19291 stop:19524 length:234 start_codon:yes stop_codon:yes gene_type:complete
LEVAKCYFSAIKFISIAAIAAEKCGGTGKTLRFFCLSPLQGVEAVEKPTNLHLILVFERLLITRSGSGCLDTGCVWL